MRGMCCFTERETLDGHSFWTTWVVFFSRLDWLGCPSHHQLLGSLPVNRFSRRFRGHNEMRSWFGRGGGDRIGNHAAPNVCSRWRCVTDARRLFARFSHREQIEVGRVYNCTVKRSRCHLLTNYFPSISILSISYVFLFFFFLLVFLPNRPEMKYWGCTLLYSASLRHTTKTQPRNNSAMQVGIMCCALLPTFVRVYIHRPRQRERQWWNDLAR